MPISNTRLLEGVIQALQTLGTKTDDPYSKGLVHAASIAIDELRNRDSNGTAVDRYAQGHAFTAAVLATIKNADELQRAFAALPTALSTDNSWASITRDTHALLDIAEKLSLRQLGDAGATNALNALQALFAWEYDGYAFNRQAVTNPPTATLLTAESVEDFIRSQGGDYAQARVVEFRPLSGGFSKQTTLISVETAKHGKEGFAIRADGAVKVLGLRGQDISREFHALKYAHAGRILCAEPLWLHYHEKPHYFISRQMPGRNVGDGINANEPVSDSVTRSLARAIASIHQLPVDQAHQDVVASHYAMSQPKTREQAQREFIQEWVDVWIKNGRKSPIVASSIRWILDNVPKDTRPAVLVHCDSGFNNLLVHEDKVSAVLDWEISHMGDPAEDIGWLMYQFRSDATRKCFMDEYRKAGGEEFDAYQLKYYDVVASLKMLIAMSDIGDKFESVPGASVHLCAYAVPYLKDPASAISKQIEEAEKLRRG